jgi:hypothetical protein
MFCAAICLPCEETIRIDSTAPVLPTDTSRPPRQSLGRVIHQFPLRRGRLVGWVLASIAVVALAGAVLGLVFGVILIYSRYYRFGPALALKDIPLPALLVLSLSVIGILAARRASAIWNKRIILQVNGLVILDRRGPHPWRWEEIVAFQSAVNRQYALFIYTGTSHRYTLYKFNGDRLVLDDSLVEVEMLADAIRSRLYPLLLDQAWQAYQAGKRVSFGPISLNQTAGLRIGNQVFPWQVVQSASILDGRLIVKINDASRSRTLRIRGEKLLNPDVLLTLLSRLIAN